MAMMMEESVSIYPGMKPPEGSIAESSEEVSSNEDGNDFPQNENLEHSPAMTDSESRPDDSFQGSGTKRLAFEENGEISSRKRRKQSNPIRVSTIARTNLPDAEGEAQKTTEDTGELDSELQCMHCSSTFKSREELQIHIQGAHAKNEYNQGSEDSSLYPCTRCSSNFKSREDLQIHFQETHVKNEYKLASEENVLGVTQQMSPLQMTTADSMASSLANQLFVMSYHNGIPMPVASSVSGNLPPSMMYGIDSPLNTGVPGQPQMPNGNGTGMRIFNPEAYCDICNKEFCNKYFLKTHKANKHGIYSEYSPQPPAPQYLSNLYGIAGVETMPVSTPSTTISITSAITPAVVSAVSTPTVTSMSSTGKDSAISSALLEMPQKPVPDVVRMPTPGSTKKGSGIVDPEAYCDICKKEFCNKYFLKKHKQNIHGIPPASSSSSSMIGNKPQLVNKVTDSKPVSPKLPIDATPESVGQGEGFQVQDGLVSEANGVTDPEAYCELCKKQFCNKYFLRSHKLNMHGIQMSNTGWSFSAMSLMSPTMVPPPSMVPPALLFAPHGKISPGQQQIRDDPSPKLPLPDLGEHSRAEAVCDICHKVFHNHYYLQQHKMSKHGSTGNDESTAARKNSGEALSPSSKASTTPKASEHDAEKTAINCGICNQEFANKEFLQIHLFNFHGILPSQDDVLGREVQQKESEMSEEMRDAMVNQHLQEVYSAKLKERVTCDLCGKEVCNKYFLRAHKLNMHGVLSSDESLVASSRSQEMRDIINVSPGQRPLSSEELRLNAQQPGHERAQQSVIQERAQQSAMQERAQQERARHLSAEMKQMESFHERMAAAAAAVASGMPPLTPAEIRTHPSAGIVDPESYCNICKKEFCSKYFLKTHKLNIHGIQPDPVYMPQGTTNAYLPPVSEPTPATSKEIKLPTTPDSKTGVFTGRNFCDICNKELCNKYFLKTHMLKMHGILMDDKSPATSTGGGAPSSIPTTASLPIPKSECTKVNNIVGCHLCSKEFANKYFLDMHKKNAHGIASDTEEERAVKMDSAADSANSREGSENAYPNQFMETCHFCERRFKNVKWLHQHLINDHGDMLKEQVSKPNIPAKAPDGKTCDICGGYFKDYVSLQVHLVKDHLINPKASHHEITGIPPNLPQPGMPAPHWQHSSFQQRMLEWQMAMNPTIRRTPRKRNFTCQFCPYSTRWLSNLYAHEKRHGVQNVSPFMAKKFVCKFCNRSYRYQHSLQRHILLHGRTKGMEPGLVQTEGTLKRNSTGKAKRFRCARCGERFSSKIECKQHIKAKHKKHSTSHTTLQEESTQSPSIEVYKCKFCEFNTTLFSQLRDHLQKEHGCSANSESFEVVRRAENGETGNTASANKDNLMKTDSKPPICYATPFNLTSQSSFIMQPFIVKEADAVENGKFVTSLVYLPVRSKIFNEVKSAFTLTPTEH